MLNFLKKFVYFDLPLKISVILLCLTGMAVLYSTSLSNENLSVFWRQLLFLGIGFLLYLFFCYFDYHSLAKANRVTYVIFFGLLVYLIFFGQNIRGGKRWLHLGLFSLQVAELVKVVVILGLAQLLYLKRGEINSWKILLWSLAYTALPAGLVILEPDLGSALVILALWVGIIMVSPIKKKYLLAIFLSLTLVSGITWKFFLKDFQRDRILVFINPELDPKGRGYNVRQATIAVGSGQVWGRGLAKGLQTQNRFLPERQTDFIFAATGEEFGFLGTGAVLFLYFLVFVRLLKIVKHAKDDLGMYITAGVFFLLFFHVIVNVGMNIGLLPVTGIPLPFFSAGGSSLIAVLVALGIAQNVNLQSKMLRF